MVPYVRQILRLMLVVAGWVGFGTLVAPWVVLELARAAWREGRHVVRAICALRLSLATHLRCPRGHASSLHALWECRTCSASFAGWAFERCPVCGAGCGYVNCELCGLAVRNPMIERPR